MAPILSNQSSAVSSLNVLVTFPEVVAVVVTFNPNLTVLEQALKSYRSKCLVVIVDNGSDSITLTNLRNKVSSTCKLIECGANYGIAVALNRGIRAGLDWQPEYYCLLDQDSVLEEGTLECLVTISRQLALQKGTLPVVAPVPVARNSGVPIGMYFKLSAGRHSQKVSQVESIYTSGLVVPASLAVEAPQMESFFIDYVDTEWCYRVRTLYEAEIYVAHKARIFHQVGDSEFRLGFVRRRPLLVHSPLRQYFQLRNAIWMLRLPYIPVKARLTIVLRCLARVGILATSMAPRGIRLKYIACAFFDGLRGRSGSHLFLPEQSRVKKFERDLAKIH